MTKQADSPIISILAFELHGVNPVSKIYSSTVYTHDLAELKGRNTAVIQFPKLFEPGRIGQMEVKNRIVLPPMSTNFCLNEGYISQRLIDYYEERARGGVGLLITEGMAVEARGRRRFLELSLADDSFIPGLSKLARAVHKHGARIAPQLLHRGQQARSVVTGQQPVSPSPFSITGGEVPHELSLEEIAGIVRSFASSARRAREAGCDGVEIHAAHMYLVSQFLSPAANHRTDIYGGPLANRARFLIEIISAVKESVGPDFPVWYRLTVQEYGIENGITLAESREVVRLAEKAGADAVNVSIFGYGAQDAISTPFIPGAELPLAAEIKKLVHTPVMAVGWLNPEVGERALTEGQADFICLGRRLIADPAIAKKAASGRIEDIRPCLGCNECMQSVGRNLDPVHCAVNASLGQEKAYRARSASTKKKVIVVGGGPAGMEAARVAAERGHRVTLYEKNSALGGLLALAALPPDKEPVSRLLDYMARQVIRAGVDIRTGTEAGAELIIRSRPDAVILAAGAVPSMPQIPGVDRPNVFKAVDVLSGKSRPGGKVVILGGGMVGCETGHYLARRGHSVTIIEILGTLAADIEVAAIRQRLLDGLAETGVRLLTNTGCREIGEGGVTVVDRSGRLEDIPADSILIAVGSSPDQGLYRALKGQVPELYQIGDGLQPARILEAIASGARAGHAL